MNKKILILWPRYLSVQKLFFETFLKNPGVTIVFIGKWNVRNAYNEKQDGFLDLKSSRALQWNFSEIRIGKISFWDSFRMFCKIWTILREEHWGLVITSTQYPLHSRIAFVLSKLFKIKIGIYTEEWIFKHPQNPIEKIKSKLNKILEIKADHILTQSEHKSAIYQTKGVRTDRIIVLPFLVNDYMRNHWRVREKGDWINMLYLGRFIGLKGIDILLESFWKLSCEGLPIKIILAGGTKNDLIAISENMNNLYQRICDDGYGNRINIIGYLDEIQKGTILNDIDVFIFPTKIKEGWGMSLMDATQSGAICIATDVVASAKELIVEGENGFIVPPNNSEELSRAIEKCVNLSEDEFKSFSLKSRELFCKYNNPDNVLTALSRL